MRGGVSTGDGANDLRLAELHAWSAVRRAMDRLVGTPLSLRWAVYVARKNFRRNVASWRRTFIAMTANDA